MVRSWPAMPMGVQTSQGRTYDRPSTIQPWAFDLLALNGQDSRPQPLVKRHARLRALLERFGCLSVSMSEPFEDGLALLRGQGARPRGSGEQAP
jgi:ATP-dependent DNA ligase